MNFTWTHSDGTSIIIDISFQFYLFISFYHYVTCSYEQWTVARHMFLSLHQQYRQLRRGQWRSSRSILLSIWQSQFIWRSDNWTTQVNSDCIASVVVLGIMNRDHGVELVTMYLVCLRLTLQHGWQPFSVRHSLTHYHHGGVRNSEQQFSMEHEQRL